MDSYKVIGIMSGTSLDGIDLAYCHFNKVAGEWNYKILKTQSIPYQDIWKKKLSEGFKLKEIQLNELSLAYGEYLGLLVLDFIQSNSLDVDFVASHGHTIFHKPEKGYTLQIGDGKTIARICKVPVVFDFRSLDVQLGGQGAPLVPIGDQHLFSGFDYCLNLGGFANISSDENQKRIAFDICPVNIVINSICESIGKSYDHNGDIAAQGKIIPDLLNQLNSLAYYQQKPPKSLGREWVEKEVLPLFKNTPSQTKDLLRTYYEHICQQIKKVITTRSNHSVLVTGGGTHNLFLMKLLKESGLNYIKASDELIDFKEALIFAFLGVLRMRNEVNCLSSVTGAIRNCSGGQIVYP